MMLQLFQAAGNGVKFFGCVGAVRCFDRAVFFSPLAQGALGDVQLLAQRFNGLALLVSADSFDFEFCWIGCRHSFSAFCGDENILYQTVGNSNVLQYNEHIKCVFTLYHSLYQRRFTSMQTTEQAIDEPISKY